MAQAKFTEDINVAIGQVTTANSNLDGSGAIVDLFTAGVKGSLIDYIRVKAMGTTTAGKINIFRKNGSSYTFIESVLVTAITPSASVKSFENEIIYNTKPFILKPGEILAFTTLNSETFNIIVSGGDF